MESLERRDLGAAGQAYIRERLAWGKTLSNVLQQLDLSNGESWTYLPSWATDDQARRFGEATAWAVPPSHREGDLQAPVALPSGFAATQGLVRRFLSEHARAVAVWEEAMWERSDRWLEPWLEEHPEEPAAFLGEEIYYILTGRTATDPSIEAGLDSMVDKWARPRSWRPRRRPWSRHSARARRSRGSTYRR